MASIMDSGMMIECPCIEKILELEVFDFTDVAFAKCLFKYHQISDENIALFLCYLFHASRQGHLCVKITNSMMTPCISQLGISGEMTEEIERRIISASTSVKETSLCLVAGPIVHNDNHYYLRKFWKFESDVMNHLTRITSQRPQMSVDKDRLHEMVMSMLQKGDILSEQAKAIISGCKHCLTCIAGGPGTGKTYTVGWLIKILQNNMNEKDRDVCKIALAAPTGKAASNLQDSISKVIGQSSFEVKTLHKLLNVSKRKRNAQQRLLDADIIIVDECSMIDIKMMSLLLSSVKSGSRIIMLGDKHQLPPVEMGSVFSDMSKLENISNNICELKKCMRIEGKSILSFADAVKNGECQAALHLLNDVSNKGLGLCRMEFDSDKELHAYVHEKFLFLDHIGDNIDKLNTFKVLTPLRHGCYGVDTLNKKIHQMRLGLMNEGQRISIPIMIARNDDRLMLSNGEVGLLCVSKNAQHENNYALFYGPQNNLLKIPQCLLPRYEYAYCISVHKSQGSEYDSVLLLMPKKTESFGREVLYTAATRTKKMLEIWENEEVIQNTIRARNLRLSGIRDGYQHINT